MRFFMESISFLSCSEFSIKDSSLFFITTSLERFRKRTLMLSRLFRKSSYLRTPSTSLYAEHNRLRSAEEFVSARDTICSESKKKKRAMSLFSIKSLINTSGPISFVSSFLFPSIRIVTSSLSKI